MTAVLTYLARARRGRLFQSRLLLLLLILSASACEKHQDPAAAFRAGEFSAAFESFSERASAGDSEAINFLGIHYYLGAGVERDFKRAAAYFEAAALENNPNAQRNLGIMYMRGLGVEQDNHRAYAWFFQAYSGGNPNARAYLQNLSDNITPNAGGQAREWVAKQVREHHKNKPKP